MVRREVTIKERRMPEREEMEDLMEWVCECLGLVKGRDTDKTSAKLLTCFLRHSLKNEPTTPEIMAAELNLSRSTVLHHLKKYMKSGLIIRTSKGYELRERTLEDTIREIEKDVEREFERIRRIARKIDEALRKL